MTNRPLIQKSAKELEALAKAAKGNPAVLQQILQELRFRKTPTAVRLRESIEQQVSGGVPVTEVGPNTERAKISQPHVVTFQRDPTPETIPPTAADQSSAEATSVVRKPRPSVTDEPENILRAWTALEVLSPQGFRKERDLVGIASDIAPLTPFVMPWQPGIKSKPGKKLLFEVVLGTLELGPAVSSLLKVYSDRRPDPPGKAGHAVMASVMVDKEGCPFDDEASLVVSSFAWGVPVALRGDLTALAAWPAEERAIKRELLKRLIRTLPSGNIASLDHSTIQQAFHFLVTRMGLEALVIREPYFAIRRYEFFASKLQPEPSCILNSFYLGDLETARRLYASGKAPDTLNLYLGRSHPPLRKNLLDDQAALQEILSPHNTPLGRWPAPGGHPLAVLQQAAVNGTTGPAESGAILAVNGPPGTGKTTLLRDIVAARIIERATAMAQLDDPARAFEASGHSVQRKGATLSFHRLTPSLRGYEMVVASSNNKAVENVSAELPTMAAIGQDAGRLRYFSSIADHVLGGENWGMVAAVLGNAGNRFNFSERFWRNEERGMSTYLNHAAGSPQFALEKNSSGNTVQRPREVVVSEAPPGDRQEARQRWVKVRKKFTDTMEAAKALVDEKVKIHQFLMEVYATIPILAELQSESSAAAQESRIAGEYQQRSSNELAEAKRLHDESVARLALHRKNGPGIFALVFNLEKARSWRQTRKILSASNVAASKELAKVTSEFDMASRHSAETAQRARDLATKLATTQAQSDKLRKYLDHVKAEGTVMPDDEHFGRPRAVREIASMWFNRQEQLLRERSFIAAVDLHRAFIDAAADPIRQNLGIFMDTYGTRSFGTSAKDALIEDLWATFFLVVPVVSTTFASMERMFSRVRPGAVGWLLVDEAGQAVPQAAVGGLFRARRAVVVGDPLQIEPVVVLPNTLTEEICGQFGISSLRYNAPEASVQTLADAASPLCGKFPAGNGWRDVGSPLLVHRRCDSPMFEISNSIAYANLMISAKPSPKIAPLLGISSWIDVREGSTYDKWSEAEAREVLNLLRQLRVTGGPPDLYIVTPFVTVQDNLRKGIIESDILTGWADDPQTWAFNNVGTVHTVQGREAAIVIFVLGAPAPSQQGARAWAGGTPNLLNVAVTRAKSAIYVVGNRQLWAQAGVFRELNNLIA